MSADREKTRLWDLLEEAIQILEQAKFGLAKWAERDEAQPSREVAEYVEMLDERDYAVLDVGDWFKGLENATRQYRRRK